MKKEAYVINYPLYYKEFHCIGGSCTDTCCGGWNIAIDHKTLNSYRREKGKLKEKLKKYVDYGQGSFRLEKRKCPFLDQEGLCSIYIEMGEEKMGKTCRRYPRHMEEFDGLREYTLSLSCPEAARIILSQGENPRWRWEDSQIFEKLKKEASLIRYLKIRKKVTEILSWQEISIEKRICICLSLCHDLQRRIRKRGEERELDEVMDRFGKEQVEMGLLPKLEQLKKEKQRPLWKEMQLFQYWCVFMELEQVTDGWQRLIREEERAAEIADGEGTAETGERSRNLESAYQQLLVYFVNVYLLGAVYDDDVYSKMKFAALSFLKIRQLMEIRRKNGGEGGLKDLADIAHIYSREIEHSDYNLEYLERAVREQKIFSLENMILCLM